MCPVGLLQLLQQAVFSPELRARATRLTRPPAAPHLTLPLPRPPLPRQVWASAAAWRAAEPAINLGCDSQGGGAPARALVTASSLGKQVCGRAEERGQGVSGV